MKPCPVILMAVDVLFFLVAHLDGLFAEFQKLWRSVPVDSIDEEKIEEYLKKQGISSMQETGPKKVVRVAFFLFKNLKTNLLLVLKQAFILHLNVVLSADDSSKEKEAIWAEKETIQNSQQPLGWSVGGLL